MYLTRTMEEKLNNLAEHFPVVIVCGARQVGKTTLLKQMQKKRGELQYVTLDYPSLRSLAKEDPELFLQQYQPPVIIDEIQYAPELLPFIKIRVDKSDLHGQYYLTGSQMFHMMKNVSESLAGRVGILSMYSLSRAEIEGRDSVPFLPDKIETVESDDTITDIFEKIYKGGMPRMITDKEMLPEDYFG
ncbi:MAG: AAA family ATPase, partial [Lachnospiraceae bacterium]|nr:AAA family ATPase [Lachnospiraceae bacterium]